MATADTTIKKPRVKKPIPEKSGEEIQPLIIGNSEINLFTDVVRKINQSKEDFERLLKEIEETRLVWEKEKQKHEQSLSERSLEEETARKREQEMYDYEILKKRRAGEDEFMQKKHIWERELEEKKEDLAAERLELLELRKKVDGFEAEKKKAVQDACLALEANLKAEVLTEKKLREQEVKSEQNVFQLRIENLTRENQQMIKEVGLFRLALDESTRQLKEVAVKVIESTSSSSKIPITTS